MRKKFCPKCGKEESPENPLIDEFCKQCSNISIFEGYKDPKIRICTNCGSYYFKKKLMPSSDDDFEENVSKIIEEMLIPRIKFNNDVEIKKLELEVDIPKGFTPAPGNNLRINTRIIVSGSYNSKMLKEEKNMNLKVNFISCKRCNLENSKYYEAILQIRPHSDKIVSFVKGMVSQRKDVFITQEDMLDEGIDLYITSQQYTKTIVSRLKSKFSGEVKITSKLFSQRKDGKKLYRTTFLFRISKPL